MVAGLRVSRDLIRVSICVPQECIDELNAPSPGHERGSGAMR
jgi:hypothetical protein